MNILKSNGLSSKIVSKEILDANNATFDILEKYKRTIGILERTNVALGKKMVFESTSGSSINGNINLNTLGRTH